MTLTQPPYHQFTHQEVRDLAWACLSPPLMQNLPGSDAHIWAASDHAVDLEWLTALDKNPAALLAELAKSKSTRLGIYFENLLRFYWQQNSHTQLLAHNLQVQTPDAGKIKGNTRGAFDFLFRQADQYWHLESAVKFYLGLPGCEEQASQWQQWIGPNCNDRLDLKLNHLRHHQLVLGRDEYAQEMLTQLVGTAVPWRKGLCLQGYLFYPAAQTISVPMDSNPLHLRGTWWYLQDFLQQAATRHWLVLPRARWLSPAQTRDIHELHSGHSMHEILQHWVAERHKPQLLAAMQKDGNLWVEKARAFVVPDHWPWTDLPSRNTKL